MSLTNKVFLGGLPGDILADEVKEAFKEYGKIENVEILYDKETKKCRGFGFITFDSPEPADKVLALQHFSIAGKLVEVKSANPKVDRNKMSGQGHGHGPPHMGGSSGMGPGGHPPSMPPGYPYPYPYPYPPGGPQQQRPGEHGNRSPPPHGPAGGGGGGGGGPPGAPGPGGQAPHPAMYHPYYAMYYAHMTGGMPHGMPPGYTMPPGYGGSSSYTGSSRHRSRSPRRSRSRSRSPRRRSPHARHSPRRYRSRSRSPPYRGGISPGYRPSYPARSPGGRSPSPRRDYLAAYGSSMPVDYLYGRREKERSPSPRRPRSPPSSYNPY